MITTHMKTGETLMTTNTFMFTITKVLFLPKEMAYAI